jgi:hypothetical protein
MRSNNRHRLTVFQAPVAPTSIAGSSPEKILSGSRYDWSEDEGWLTELTPETQPKVLRRMVWKNRPFACGSARQL